MPRRRIKKKEQPTGVRDWDRLDPGATTRDYSWSADRYREEGVDYRSDTTLGVTPVSPWNPRGRGEQMNKHRGREMLAGDPVILQALVEDGWSYPEARIRYQRATGSDLPKGLYRKVAESQDKIYLVEEAAASRFRCSACGTLFGMQATESVDLSCPHCKSAEVTSLLLDEQPLRTQWEEGQNYQDLGEEFDPRPMSASVAAGDMLRSMDGRTLVKVIAATEDSVCSLDLRTQETHQIPSEDLWAWEHVGTHIGAEDLLDE